MENFDKVFTVEVRTSKAWEVVSTHNDVESAIKSFRRELGTTPVWAVRLTSPTDLSIYE